jgi:4a-hydroxytetrahydrobiopterin dehydratase
LSQGAPVFFACEFSSPYSLPLALWREVILMSKLIERKCEPCEGGVAPLTPAEAGVLMKELHNGWTLDSDHIAIERRFEFPAFSRTMAFVNAVAFVATNEGHHPEVTFSYGYCRVRYWTHAIGGLSDNDFICAAKIDRLAEEM